MTMTTNADFIERVYCSRRYPQGTPTVSFVVNQRDSRPRGLLSLKLLKLIPGLRARRIELHGLLKIPDRALLVTLRVSCLSHRLICACRLRVVLQIRL